MEKMKVFLIVVISLIWLEQASDEFTLSQVLTSYGSKGAGSFRAGNHTFVGVQ